MLRRKYFASHSLLFLYLRWLVSTRDSCLFGFQQSRPPRGNLSIHALGCISDGCAISSLTIDIIVSITRLNPATLVRTLVLLRRFGTGALARLTSQRGMSGQRLDSRILPNPGRCG